MKRASKYNAKKVEVDGIKFDSKAESEFYLHLKELKESGEITDFMLQPKYELQPAFEKRGVKFRAIMYVADFLVYHTDGSEQVIDIKGMETADFKLKKKMFEYKFPQKLSLICKAPKYMAPRQWVELDELKEIRKKRKKEKGNK